MRGRKGIAASLLLSALVLLNTCQMQFNKSSGNVALRVVIPAGMTGGGKSVPGSKSLTNGTTLTVTISQEGTSFTTQQTVPINGGSSIDFSFSLSSTGTYDVSAVMEDASGDTLAQNTTKLTVPAGNYPVILTMFSNLLLSAVITDASGATLTFNPSFSPTTTAYTIYYTQYYPWTLTLTTVDPNATITSVTEYGTADSHSGNVYTLQYNGNGDTATVLVTGEDGSTQTYTLNLQGG